MSYPRARVSHTEKDYLKTFELYERGITITEISKLINVNRNTINSWIHRGKKPKSMWTDEERETLSKRLSETSMGELNPQWKGNDCLENTARERARRMYVHLCPEGCEIHHIDGNPWNNAPDNIDFVTRKKHMEKDGRLEKQIERLSKGDNVTKPVMSKRLREKYGVPRNKEIYFMDGDMTNISHSNLLFLTRKEAIDNGFINRERDDLGRFL